MSAKGFLITDATGNIIYVNGSAAVEISKMIIHEVAQDERITVINNLRTVQCGLISQYIGAKDDEEVREIFNAWKGVRNE